MQVRPNNVLRKSVRRKLVVQEKQTLLKSLREHFKRDFLTAYDFYQSHCTARISFKEYETEKTNYVRSWAKDYLNTDPDIEQAMQRLVLIGYQGRRSTDVQVVAVTSAFTSLGSPHYGGFTRKRGLPT